VRNNINQIVMMQEVVGSGGAGFRFMFAAFLTEAAEILTSDDLAQAGRDMTVLGDRWREFALVCARHVKNRTHADDTYETMIDMLNELANREEAAYRRLREIIQELQAAHR
jgi:hypothetical protein